MPVSRYYSTAAVEMRLGTALANAGGGAAAGDSVTITLTNVPGTSGGFNLPTNVPFTLIIDPDTSQEEVVEVTSVTTLNSTYVITRAVDSSILSSHSVGAVVKHGVSARDYAESRSHEAATTGVHGVTGAIAPIASPTFTGTVTVPTLSVTSGMSLSGSLTGGTVNPSTLRQNSITVPLAFSSGIETISISSSTTGSVNVSFPGSRFTVSPVVTAIASNAAYNLSVTSLSSTGCTINARHIDGTSTTTTITVYWIAIQQTSTAYSAGTAQ